MQTFVKEVIVYTIGIVKNKRQYKIETKLKFQDGDTVNQIQTY
jgi:hypothetical protein